MAEAPRNLARLTTQPIGPNSKYLRERGGAPPRIFGMTPGPGQDTVSTDEVIRFIKARLEAHRDEHVILTIEKPGAGKAVAMPKPIYYNELDQIFNSYDEYNGIAMAGAAGEHVKELMWAKMVFYKNAPAQPAGAGLPGESSSDCLFRAIQRAFGGKVPYEVYSDAVLRERLGVDHSGPIPVAGLFQKLDAIFPHVKFTLTTDLDESHPDHVYESPRDSSVIINIKLTAGHFTLVNPPVEFRPTTSKPMRLIEYGDDSVSIWSSGCDQPQVMTRAEFEKVQGGGYLSADSWYNVISGRERSLKLSHADILAEWDRDRRDLLAGTDNKLDLNKYGSIRRVALAAWRMNSLAVAAPPQLGPVEQKWVSAAMRGGLIYGKKGWSGMAIGLDINSCYPAVLASASMVPMMPGEEKLLLPGAAMVGLGFYRCIITGCPPALFRQEAGVGTYTQQDVRTAIKLGGVVQLAQDGKPNAYLYTNTTKQGRLRFNEIFGPFIKQFYAMKLTGAPVAKKVMNILTGALAERTTKKIRVTGPTDIAGSVLKIHCDDIEGDFDATYQPDDEPMFRRGGWARLYPFIVGRGREIMADTFASVVDRVVRIHTDGVVLSGTEIPAGITIGTGLGEWKLEHTAAHVTVKNPMRVEGWK